MEEKLCYVDDGIDTALFRLSFKTVIKHSIHIYSVNSGSVYKKIFYENAPNSSIGETLYSSDIKKLHLVDSHRKKLFYNGLFFSVFNIH